VAPRKQKAKRSKTPKVIDFRGFIFLSGKQNGAEYGSLSGGIGDFFETIKKSPNGF
jgi:hypothetical protein